MNSKRRIFIYLVLFSFVTQAQVGNYYAPLQGMMSGNPLNSTIRGSWAADYTTKDTIGSNNGTLTNGATYAAGKIGGAYSTDGVDDAIVLANNSYNYTGDYTIAQWVYATSGTYNVCFQNYSFNGTNYYGWQLGIFSSKIYFTIGQGNGTLIELDAPSTMSFNAWHRVVITRKQGTRTRMYIDNSLVASNSSAIDAVYAATNYCVIGAQTVAGAVYTNSWAGLIDCTVIANTEWASTDVAYDYFSGTGRQPPY